MVSTTVVSSRNIRLVRFSSLCTADAAVGIGRRFCLGALLVAVELFDSWLLVLVDRLLSTAVSSLPEEEKSEVAKPSVSTAGAFIMSTTAFFCFFAVDFLGVIGAAPNEPGNHLVRSNISAFCLIVRDPGIGCSFPGFLL